MRISKREFYAQGGLRNPKLYRRQSANGAWRYYKAIS